MAFKPYFELSIPEGYSPDERKAIAEEIIDYVITRTESGKKIGGKSNFPSYTADYAEEKGQDNVDLTFSGDMLAEMALLKQGRGILRIGYESGYEGIGKVEGNVLGTYGQSKPIKGKARNFLGLTKEELNSILSKYPLNDDEARSDRAATSQAARSAAERLARNSSIENPDE